MKARVVGRVRLMGSHGGPRLMVVGGRVVERSSLGAGGVRALERHRAVLERWVLCLWWLSCATGEASRRSVRAAAAAHDGAVLS